MAYLTPNIVIARRPEPDSTTTWCVSVYVRSPDHVLLLAAQTEVEDQAAALAFADRYRLRQRDPVFRYPITEIDIVPVRTMGVGEETGK